MIALVFGVIAFSTRGIHVVRARIQVDEDRHGALEQHGITVPMSVIGGTITSSSGEIPAAMQAAWIAAVPLVDATACWRRCAWRTSFQRDDLLPMRVEQRALVQRLLELRQLLIP
jgi:hypothetical protein